MYIMKCYNIIICLPFEEVLHLAAVFFGRFVFLLFASWGTNPSPAPSCQGCQGSPRGSAQLHGEVTFFLFWLKRGGKSSFKNSWVVFCSSLVLFQKNSYTFMVFFQCFFEKWLQRVVVFF